MMFIVFEFWGAVLGGIRALIGYLSGLENLQGDLFVCFLARREFYPATCFIHMGTPYKELLNLLSSSRSPD